jgi:hypothetical protein
MNYDKQNTLQADYILYGGAFVRGRKPIFVDTYY